MDHELTETERENIRLTLIHMRMPRDLIEAAIDMGVLIAAPRREGWAGSRVALALNLSDGKRAVKLDIDREEKHEENWWAQKLLWLRAAREAAEAGEELADDD